MTISENLGDMSFGTRPAGIITLQSLLYGFRPAYDLVSHSGPALRRSYLLISVFPLG
jgi:hypothetical protein